jgi:hypothetical protein
LWRVENESAPVRHHAFRVLSRAERGALTEEGGRPLRFMAPDADDQDVIIQADHASGGWEAPASIRAAAARVNRAPLP